MAGGLAVVPVSPRRWWLAGCAALLLGCGGTDHNRDTLVPAANPANVAGTWTVTRTQTESSHATCGNAGTVAQDNWTVAQTGAALTITANAGTPAQTSYTGTLGEGGVFTAKGERLISANGGCFVVSVDTFTGTFNAAAGTATGAMGANLLSDPPPACAAQNTAPSCTAAFTLALQKQP